MLFDTEENARPRRAEAVTDLESQSLENVEFYVKRHLNIEFNSSDQWPGRGDRSTVFEIRLVGKEMAESDPRGPAVDSGTSRGF